MSSHKIYDDISLYFITSTIVKWYPVFTESSYFKIIIDSLEYCRKEKGLKIHAYVIMLNHIHLIVSVDAKTSKNLSDVFRDFKRFTSNEITELVKEEGKPGALDIFKKAASQAERDNDYKVWQDGFHPKGIYDEEFGLQKLEYIHKNPVKKGYVLKPEHWFYSSASFYRGINNSPLQIDGLFEISE